MLVLLLQVLWLSCRMLPGMSSQHSDLEGPAHPLQQVSCLTQKEVNRTSPATPSKLACTHTDEFAQAAKQAPNSVAFSSLAAEPQQSCNAKHKPRLRRCQAPDHTQEMPVMPGPALLQALTLEEHLRPLRPATDGRDRKPPQWPQAAPHHLQERPSSLRAVFTPLASVELGARSLKELERYGPYTSQHLPDPAGTLLL